MSKEEIISHLLVNSQLGNNREAIRKLMQQSWNSAIQSAVENACIDGEWITNDLGNDICVCGELDKESILKLKFKQ